MMQLTSTASVTTDRPTRYAKQLTSHLGRKVATEWDADAEQGWVDFGSGRATLAAGDGVLLIALVADDPDARDRLEDVVGRHLVRFGAKDELECAWSRTDGTTGSVHRSELDPDEAGPDEAGADEEE